MDALLIDTWNEIVSAIQAEDYTGQTTAYFNKTHIVGFENNTFIITAENNWVKAWIEKSYMALTKEVIAKVTGIDFDVQFVIEREDKSIENNPYNQDKIKSEIEQQYAGENNYIEQQTVQHMNPTVKQQPAAVQSGNTKDLKKYTFETLVIGDSNRFACGAAQAVAENPGQTYNPLFIWGKPGLGKTHLLCAIANYVKDNNTNMSVVYSTSEQLVKEVTDATRQNNWDVFLAKYRTADIFLLDDLQFLEGKEGTLDQFFNTFNELKNFGKQIVLSADRAPKDINVEERLRSRFLSGLLVDIQPPNFEMRLAIITKYLDYMKSTVPNFIGTVPDDVKQYIAEVSTPNVREIEGALNVLISYMTLSNLEEISLEEAKYTIKDFFTEKVVKKVEVRTIQEEVEKQYSISHEDMIGKKRSAEINTPRQIAMYLSRVLTDDSFPIIGENFGGRDHTTIMNGVKNIERQMKEDRELYDRITELTVRIKGK